MSQKQKIDKYVSKTKYWQIVNTLCKDGDGKIDIEEFRQLFNKK